VGSEANRNFFRIIGGHEDIRKNKKVLEELFSHQTKQRKQLTLIG
jgi:hypothetical protein